MNGLAGSAVAIGARTHEASPRAVAVATRRPAQTIGIVICSYRRPDALLPCLQGLARQDHRPDDVIVVARQDDTATRELVRDHTPHGLACRIVPVLEPGLVAARNAGLQAVMTDVVAFCDDDTVAHPAWTQRILSHFAADPSLGGLGGRDNVHDGERFDERRHPVVGRLDWFGRAVGNHHLGFGSPREVHFLKGANMSYRAEAVAGLRFDRRLRGRSAQAHDDLSFSFAVWRHGWKLLYDPEVALDHYAFRPDQPRAYVAASGLPDSVAYADSCYNYTLTLWDRLTPLGRAGYAIWSTLVGMRVYPGLAQAIRLSPREGRTAWRKFAIYQRASWAVYRDTMAGSIRDKGRVPRPSAG